ncbi:hypothetical protein P6F26_18090 [Roseibacterium sp. SDUM158017]|uniref:hypothetical protein n=1 Tax=Roseicyclus salinarum TaxID=3036773 RepID=UPI0024155E53|nr:hypothetical protein [Roseibacterium sp. SDUM158017]MDG4650359.1 hypothetical protein [Roseibacterium sp. SDUM158017]
MIGERDEQTRCNASAPESGDGSGVEPVPKNHRRAEPELRCGQCPDERREKQQDERVDEKQSGRNALWRDKGHRQHKDTWHSDQDGAQHA